MKRVVVICISIMLLCAAGGRAQESEIIDVNTYFQGFTVYDARVIAQKPFGDHEIFSYGLIKEQYSTGLDGEGKEIAVLATETMKNLRMSASELDEDTSPDEAFWRFSVSIDMEDPADRVSNRVLRKVVISFYDSNRNSRLSVMDNMRDQSGEDHIETIYDNYCEVPIDAVKIFEDMYLQRVCSLTSDWPNQ